MADASAARAAEEIASRVKEVAEYSDAQASRVTADVTQRLEQEIVAAVTSTATMAEVTTRTVVEGVRRTSRHKSNKTAWMPFGGNRRRSTELKRFPSNCNFD